MLQALETAAQRRFTVEEYHRMAETGILGPGERVELVRGAVSMSREVGARLPTLVGVVPGGAPE